MFTSSNYFELIVICLLLHVYIFCKFYNTCGCNIAWGMHGLSFSATTKRLFKSCTYNHKKECHIFILVVYCRKQLCIYMNLICKNFADHDRIRCYLDSIMYKLCIHATINGVSHIRCS